MGLVDEGQRNRKAETGPEAFGPEADSRGRTGAAELQPWPQEYGCGRGEAPPSHRQARRAGGSSAPARCRAGKARRSEEHTSELQSLMRISYAVFCLKKKQNDTIITLTHHYNHDSEQSTSKLPNTQAIVNH